jgi:hypothetical protein
MSEIHQDVARAAPPAELSLRNDNQLPGDTGTSPPPGTIDVGSFPADMSVRFTCGGFVPVGVC